MKIISQSTASLTQLGQLIEDIPVAMFTSQDAQGALVSRPMTALEMDVNGAIWFFTDVNSTKLEHMDEVNLSFADPARACYVSVSGHGRIGHGWQTCRLGRPRQAD